MRQAALLPLQTSGIDPQAQTGKPSAQAAVRADFAGQLHSLQLLSNPQDSSLQVVTGDQAESLQGQLTWFDAQSDGLPQGQQALWEGILARIGQGLVQRGDVASLEGLVERLAAQADCALKAEDLDWLKDLVQSASEAVCSLQDPSLRPALQEVLSVLSAQLEESAGSILGPYVSSNSGSGPKTGLDTKTGASTREVGLVAKPGSDRSRTPGDGLSAADRAIGAAGSGPRTGSSARGAGQDLPQQAEAKPQASNQEVDLEPGRNRVPLGLQTRTNPGAESRAQQAGVNDLGTLTGSLAESGRSESSSTLETRAGQTSFSGDLVSSLKPAASGLDLDQGSRERPLLEGANLGPAGQVLRARSQRSGLGNLKGGNSGSKTGAGQAQLGPNQPEPTSGQQQPQFGAQPKPGTIQTNVEHQVLDQVRVRFQSGLRQGQSEVVVRMHPPELGEVRLNLLSEDGSLRAHLHAQSQQVQDILQRNAPQLRDALAQQGLDLDDVLVSSDGAEGQDLQSEWQGANEGAARQSRNPAGRGSGEGEPDQSQQASAGRHWNRGSGSLSLRI